MMPEEIKEIVRKLLAWRDERTSWEAVAAFHEHDGDPFDTLFEWLKEEAEKPIEALAEPEPVTGQVVRYNDGSSCIIPPRRDDLPRWVLALSDRNEIFVRYGLTSIPYGDEYDKIVGSWIVPITEEDDFDYMVVSGHEVYMRGLRSFGCMRRD